MLLGIIHCITYLDFCPYTSQLSLKKDLAFFPPSMGKKEGENIINFNHGNNFVP